MVLSFSSSFLALVALLLSEAQAWDYSPTAKPPTNWINSDVFFKPAGSRSIGGSSRFVPHSDSELYIDAGFYCVSSISPCDELLFAASIHSIDTQQIVWSANQDRPVTENATLEFTADGNLVLHDADGSHVWSSNSSDRSVAGMVITEIGNLVLFDHRNATVW